MQDIMNWKKFFVLVLVLALVSSSFSFAAPNNEKQSLDVYKADGVTGEGLAGATFQLEKVIDVPGTIELSFELLDNQISGDSGLATFSDIDLGGPDDNFFFRVTETVAPPLYYKSNEVWYFNYDKDKKYWNFMYEDDFDENDPIGSLDDAYPYFPGVGFSEQAFYDFPELAVYKTDPDGKPLKDAKFTLYKLSYNQNDPNANLEMQYAGEATSDADGKALFTADAVLDQFGYPNFIYMVEETTAPDGYIKSDQKFYFKLFMESDDVSENGWRFLPEVTEDNYYDVFEEVEKGEPYTDQKFINTPPELDVYKVNHLGDALAGAVFQLDRAAAVPEGPLEFNTIGTATSEVNGFATFSKLDVGNDDEEFIFRVTEVTAPQGYIKSNMVLYFYFDKYGGYWRFMVGKDKDEITEDADLLGIIADRPQYVNDDNPFVNIPALVIDKVDQDGQPLADAQFTITALTYESGQIKATKAQDDVFSDADGKATFDQLNINLYDKLTYFKVEEVKAPDGYIKSDQKLYFYFNDSDYYYDIGWMLVPEEFVEDDLKLNEPEHAEPYEDIPFVNLPGELDIYKVDQDGAPLAGATFEVASTTSPSSIVTATSNAEGHAFFAMLPDDSYTVREKAAPSGYKKSNATYQFVISNGQPVFGSDVPSAVFMTTSSGAVLVTPGAITVTPGAITTTHAAIKFINEKEKDDTPPSGGSTGGGSTGGDGPKLNRKDHFAYIQGYPDGLVKPENYVTRQEVAAIFFRLLDNNYRETIRSTSNSFSDVDQLLWSNKHISTLAKGDILRGYLDGTFRPTGYITRGELAAVVTRFDKLEPAEYNFTDKTGHWAEPDIAAAAAKGWINGYPDGSFKPERYITRAELVTLINNVLGRNVRLEDILPDAKKFPDITETDWFYTDIMIASNSYLYEQLADFYQKWIKIIYPVIEM